ncbi:hypothetical protein MSG28_015195 [Choristoneura fumiferana]|uniref:Uncharacterized protein n=1 Tax=Choristoneura fumiferana TaxID=7141 RepID=A0ACC0KYP2_CHOFU|nr:hypothetical protein MSG28_015195 [Choristoneura fumiferana]
MTRLSKCAAFRDRCHRSTALLRTLVEEELLTMNNIKMVDRETHKLTNGLTLAALYHFQTHPVLDILPAFSENQNKDTQQEPDYTEIEYLETDNGAEYLDIGDSKATIDGDEDIKVEMVNENSDANSDDDDDVEYKPENDISDVDTDTLEEALVAIERERKSVKPGKDIVKYGEVNKNVKTKVYKYPTGVETDESEETIEIRRKVKNKKHLLQKHSTKTTTVKKSLFKESLAAFSKDFNCTIKVLNKEQQRQEVEERKGNNKSAYCCDLCGKGFRKKSAVMKHLSYHDPSLPHECDACRLRFRSRLKLLKHRQSHRAVYTCNECGYASRFRTYVKNHWLMHKGTTYTCPYCQIVYNHQTSYYNHIRIQHPGENEACDECGETFAAGRGMNLHKALAHRMSDKSNAKHKCKDCDVKFLNAEALQRHEELGAGVPHAALWPCAACGDSCGSDTALKAHAAEQHTDRHHCDEAVVSPPARKRLAIDYFLAQETNKRYKILSMSAWRSPRTSESSGAFNRPSHANTRLQPATKLHSLLAARPLVPSYSLYSLLAHRRRWDKQVVVNALKCSLTERLGAASSTTLCRRHSSVSSFIMRTAKEWNSLPRSVLPERYNLDIFKFKVNRHLLGKPSEIEAKHVRAHPAPLTLILRPNRWPRGFDGQAAPWSSLIDDDADVKADPLPSPGIGLDSCRLLDGITDIRRLKLVDKWWNRPLVNFHVVNKVSIYFCRQCNKTFLNSESFELHVQRKHMNKRAVEGPFRPRVGVGRRQPCVYVCEICGKVFKNSTLLQYHMNGHLAVKPFPVQTVSQNIPAQGALNLHMRVHTGERPYQCEQCPQAFASPSNLSRHTKYRHTKYRELVKCNICGKLLRAVSLSLHVRTVHQNLRYERKRNPKRTRVVAEP